MNAQDIMGKEKKVVSFQFYENTKAAISEKALVKCQGFPSFLYERDVLNPFLNLFLSQF